MPTSPRHIFSRADVGISPYMIITFPAINNIIMKKGPFKVLFSLYHYI